MTQINKKTKALILAVCLAAALLVGAGAYYSLTHSHAGAVLPQTQTGQQPAGQTASLISVTSAKQAALRHAGVSSDDATFYQAQLGEAGGVPVYQIGFSCHGVDYSYQIHACQGSVLHHQSCHTSADFSGSHHSSGHHH